jgi:acetyl-CoA C-acetyltransferase
MTDVVIVGIGQTPVGEHWGLSLRSLAVKALRLALADAGGQLRPESVFIGNSLASALSHQSNLGSLVADMAGLRGAEGVSVEAGGASGGSAAHLAYQAVASGVVSVAAVVGVEKYTDLVGPKAESAIAHTLDYDYEAVPGLTQTAQAALLMQRYMYCYEAPRQGFAGFPIIAHANAVSNPNAIYRRALSLETYAKAEMVSEPLGMYDLAPYADGSAALIITRADLLPANFDRPLVRFAGSSVVTDALALHDRPEPLAFQAAGFSVERACEQAGMPPQDADFFELFDAYSIYSILSLEAAGLAPRGEGWRLAEDGRLSLKGGLPIATFGGLKGRGNPIGATGVYQLVEAALQLRGQAGPNQVEGAQRGMVQSLGGPASTAVTTILESMKL